MERRVIKFNLVGAIFVLMLIIATIVGITIFTVNFIRNKNESENDKELQKSEVQQLTFSKNVVE